jgi:hypothetical protein
MNTSKKALNITNFDTSSIVFLPIKEETTGPYKGKRINLGVKYEDGSIGNLIFKTTKLYSFGIKEFKDESTNRKSHSFSLSLWNKNGPSDEEKLWTDKFTSIVDYLKNYLLKNKKEYKLAKLQEGNFSQFCSAYKQKTDDETGELIGSPVLYPKVWIKYDRDTNEIEKVFSTFKEVKSGRELSIQELLGSRCEAKSAIKLESIYINSAMNCFLKVTVLQSNVKILEPMKMSYLSSDSENENESVGTFSDDDNTFD